jgi:hypothetical protein
MWIDMKITMYLLAALLQFGGSRPINWEQPLRVEIKTAQVSVKTGQRVPVSTWVRNSGSTDATIEIWACAFPSEWVVDNPSVEIEQPNCVAENRSSIVLKPGGEYQRDLMIFVHLGTANFDQKELSFRLGFRNGVFRDEKHQPKTDPVWSNSATLKVTK